MSTYRLKRKVFSEYDAMRSLYVELMKYSDRSKFGIIDSSALIPILRGNNIVIEKFVISTSFFGRDKYRMYLKIGAKAKMPDEVRLPQRVYDKRLGNMQVNFQKGLFDDKPQNQKNNWDNKKNYNNNNKEGLNTEAPTNDRFNKKQKNHSEIVFREKIFGGNKDKQFPVVNASFSPQINISYQVKELIGDAVKYDKKSRSLVLEFSTIQDAIRALNILPFGLGYKIYLLNA